MTENPYSSPIVQPNSKVDQPFSAPTRTLVGIAKTTFLAWEKLRIVYIAFLGILTLVITGSRITNIEFIIVIAFWAIFANVCYLAGPIVETYICWLGYEHQWVRWSLFISGTLLTALLAIETITMLIRFAEV